MPVFSIFALAEDQLTISDGAVLSGFSQGDGSHLFGRTITLNSNAWDEIEIDDNDASFADNDSSQRLDGAQTFFGTLYDDNLVVEAEYTLTVEDPDGNSYTVMGVNVREPGQSPAYGTVEGLAFVDTFPPRDVPLTVVGAAEGPGGSTTAYDAYATPPCFLSGTLIATPDGDAPVERISEGDLVLTQDNGPQPVVWAGATHLRPSDLRARPETAPVCIPRNVVDGRLPTRDLWISPQHRVLVTGWRAELFFGAPEVLAAAKHVVSAGGTTTVRRAVTYHHLKCPGHEIIYAEGLPTESFRAGPETLAGLQPDDRSRLLELCPDLASGHAEPPVRPLVRASETQLFSG